MNFSFTGKNSCWIMTSMISSWTTLSKNNELAQELYSRKVNIFHKSWTSVMNSFRLIMMISNLLINNKRCVWNCEQWTSCIKNERRLWTMDFVYDHWDSIMNNELRSWITNFAQKKELRLRKIGIFQGEWTSFMKKFSIRLVYVWYSYFLNENRSWMNIVKRY